MKTCFVCNTHIINGWYYSLSIAIKPPHTKNRRKDTGIVICEGCYEGTQMEGLLLDPWLDKRREQERNSAKWRSLWKQFKDFLQRNKHTDLFDKMNQLEKKEHSIKKYGEAKHKTCPDCGHTLEGNNHGPDQNDFFYNPITGKHEHSGVCTYCIYCNDKLMNRLKEEKE